MPFQLKMKLKMLQDLKKCGLPPQISFKPDPTTWKKPDKNKYSLKVEINTQSGYMNRKMVSIYTPIFNTGSVEALLKFLVILKKIMKDQNLTNGPHCYTTTNNIIFGEALRVSNQKYQENINKAMNINDDIHSVSDEPLLSSE